MSNSNKIELSLCSSCKCMTWTVKKRALSASENVHFRYECGKCGFKKELKIIKRIGEFRKNIRQKKCVRKDLGF